MMIESLDRRPGLPPRAPRTRRPDAAWPPCEPPGELAIPFTTGMLVGIGETRAERLDALEAIADAHRRYGHVQEVIVQNFLPKPGTAMHRAPPCPPEELAWTIAVARLMLPPDVHLQAPPNLSDDLAPLLGLGHRRLGRRLAGDHRPREPRAGLAGHRRSCAAATEAAGLVLAPRLTLYPEFALDPERWLDPAMRFAVLDHSDAEGLGRDDAWCSGGTVEPPALLGAVADRPAGAVPVRRAPGAGWPRSSPGWPSARRWARTRS